MPMSSGHATGNTPFPCAAPDRRALESYLRFSFPLGKNGLFCGKTEPYEEPCFHFEPEREKDAYLNELNCILHDILKTECGYSGERTRQRASHGQNQPFGLSGRGGRGAVVPRRADGRRFLHRAVSYNEGGGGTHRCYLFRRGAG